MVLVFAHSEVGSVTHAYFLIETIELFRIREIEDSWKKLISILDSVAKVRQEEHKAFGEFDKPDLLTRLVVATDETKKYPLEHHEVVSGHFVVSC